MNRRTKRANGILDEMKSFTWEDLETIGEFIIYI